MSKKRREAALRRWQNFTPEQLEMISQKHKESAQALWDSYTEEQRRERGRRISEGKRLKRLAKGEEEHAKSS